MKAQATAGFAAAVGALEDTSGSDHRRKGTGGGARQAVLRPRRRARTSNGAVRPDRARLRSAFRQVQRPHRRCFVLEVCRYCGEAATARAKDRRAGCAHLPACRRDDQARQAGEERPACGRVRLPICRFRDEAREARKKSRPPATPPPDGAARLDKGEKRLVVPAVNPATRLPPAAPKQSTLLARAEPPAPTERAPGQTAPSLCSAITASRMYGLALRWLALARVRNRSRRAT